MMSQSDQQHMMMPSKPAAQFVMIETDFAFGFFKNDFNGPTYPADEHELDQGCIGRGIAEAELDHRRVIQVAADDPPDFGTGRLARDSMMRRKAKSHTMGPLLPSLMVAVVQPALGIDPTSS
jgi:hypothetical protein